MKFNFIVDKANIAINIVELDIINKDFANYLYDKYREDYRRIKRHQFFYTEDLSNVEIIKEIMNYKNFNKIYIKCEENCKRIEQNLKEYQQEIESFLTGLCRTELPDLELTVSIVPWGGVSFRQRNYILWGHKRGEKDKFYDLVYLYHEALHYVFTRDDISHCIIELLTDTKLAQHFHPELKDGYSKHDYINSLRVKLLPFFELYFGKSKKEIIERLKESGDIELLKSVKNTRKDLSKVNIFELERFLLKKSKLFQNMVKDEKRLLI